MTTIKEIAQLTGVSIGTVDRALHNRGRVSEETRNKILKAADKAGYKANIYARNLKRGKAYNFCVIMPDKKNDSRYWELPLKGIIKAAAEMAHYKINVEFFFYNKYDAENIVSNFGEAFKNKWDGCIVVPSGDKLFAGLIRQLPSEIPFLYFDSLVPGTDYLSYIGQDSYKSGAAAAKLMHLLAGSEGEIAVLKFTPEDYHIMQRTKGFCDHLNNYAEMEVPVIEISPDYIRNTEKQIDGLIKMKGNRLKGIFVSNASTYLAARYLEKRNLEGKIALIGYDLIKENVDYLKKGTINFIISQMSERQGYEALKTLVDSVILKQKTDKTKFMQIDIITKENVDYYQS